MAEPKVALPAHDEQTSATAKQATVPSIEGKVAQIVSERELIINRGERDGVRVGMKFAVLADRDLEVRDPDTGKVIVLYPREKTRVEIVRLFDEAALGRTYQVRVVGGRFYNLGPFLLEGIGIQEEFEPPRSVTESLDIENASLPVPLERSERIVRPGDRVALIADVD